MEKNIWDLAIDESKALEEKSGEENSVLFLGSKNGGKTSLILRYLDRDETTKPTTALEYTFARRSKGHNFGKDVGHIWELGGGTWLTRLIDIPINAQNIRNVSVALVLDLSKPDELWITLEILMKALKSRVDTVIQELRSENPDLRNELKKKSWQRLGDTHTDHDLIEPFPIPLIIIGTKFDLFQDFDSERRKVICKVLRFVAHHYGASLQFFSVRQEALINKVKGFVSNLLFQTTISKAVQLEHNKPLIIPAGTDSLQQIGPPPISDNDIGRLSANSPMELWKKAYTQYIPQQMLLDPSLVEDPAKDSQYKEAAVDEMRVSKDQELERYRKVSERKAREAQMMAR